MTVPDTVDNFVEDRFEGFVADLERLVAQPSISATGEGIRECATLLRSLTLGYGFDAAEIVETSGHPAVIAHAYVDNDPDNDAPTVLVYGHYDVQPVVPGEWTDPPFEPTVREIDGREYLYGRGTVDNKGQHFAYLAAVKTLRETVGLPVNVTLLLDGEEESGSPNLGEAVEARESALSADVSINSDGPVDESGRPTVVFGNRGILIVEVTVQGPNRDLHSGHYGGAIPNPARELSRLLNTMYADDGRIAIDGFYDDIEPITGTDRELIEAIEPEVDELTAKLGVGGLEDGRVKPSLKRRCTTRRSTSTASRVATSRRDTRRSFPRRRARPSTRGWWSIRPPTASSIGSWTTSNATPMTDSRRPSLVTGRWTRPGRPSTRRIGNRSSMRWPRGGANRRSSSRSPAAPRRTLCSRASSGFHTSASHTASGTTTSTPRTNITRSITSKRVSGRAPVCYGRSRRWPERIGETGVA